MNEAQLVTWEVVDEFDGYELLSTAFGLAIYSDDHP